MYIQNIRKDGQEMPFYVPDNYSGNAFAPPAASTPTAMPTPPPMAPIEKMPPPPEEHGEGRGEMPAPKAQKEERREDMPPFFPPLGMPLPGAAGGESPVSPDDACPPPPPPPPPRGFLDRFPFLAPLLPPPRKGKGEAGLSELALIAALIFLLSEDKDDGDILPLLLLLLFWG